MGCIRLKWVVLGLYWVKIGSNGFDFGCNGLNWILLGSHGFCWFTVGCKGFFYWVFTGFWRDNVVFFLFFFVHGDPFFFPTQVWTKQKKTVCFFFVSFLFYFFFIFFFGDVLPSFDLLPSFKAGSHAFRSISFRPEHRKLKKKEIDSKKKEKEKKRGRTRLIRFSIFFSTFFFHPTFSRGSGFFFFPIFFFGGAFFFCFCFSFVRFESPRGGRHGEIVSPFSLKKKRKMGETFPAVR